MRPPVQNSWVVRIWGKKVMPPAYGRGPTRPRRVAKCVPTWYLPHNRTVSVPRPYRSRTPPTPYPQVPLVFRFATQPGNQVFSPARSTLEIASQAEYAGSIPVIGSTLTRADPLRRPRSRGDGPVTVPYAKGFASLNCTTRDFPSGPVSTLQQH